MDLVGAAVQAGHVLADEEEPAGQLPRRSDQENTHPGRAIALHAVCLKWDTVIFLISMSHNFSRYFDINVPFFVP